jgi:DnaJ-class molecular chaperone
MDMGTVTETCPCCNGTGKIKKEPGKKSEITMFEKMFGERKNKKE